jgi:hypothetical protein
MTIATRPPGRGPTASLRITDRQIAIQTGLYAVKKKEKHMKFNSGIAAAIVLSFAVAGLTACEKGPAEKAGEKIDNAAKKVGDKMEEAGDKVKDAVKK